MSKNIQVTTDQNQVAPGAEIPVRIQIQFDKPTKVRGIHAYFHGAEKTEATYTVTTTDSKGRAKTETRTATQYFDIVKEEFLLHGEARKGFFARLIDSLKTWFGGGSHEVMGPGEKQFELNLKIPENAPASFQGKKCEVFYRLRVSVDVPIRVDWSHSEDFQVSNGAVNFSDAAPVHVTYPDKAGRSFWDKTFGKDVSLNLALDRDKLSVGDTALAMLTVDTSQPLKIDKMGMQLVGVEKVVAHGHKDSHTHTVPLGQIESPNVISSESVHEFEITIPEIEGPQTQLGQHFEVAWTIEVRLTVPWAKDPVIRVPIVIGTKKGI